jgi:ribokinase
MKVINYGSVNIDYVYRVPHISRPGETIGSTSYEVFTGGKGANQSVALARAGARVFHAGKVGKDSEWLLTKLDSLGMDTSYIASAGGRTGHAIIQVDDKGENSIVLYPGANRQITEREIDNVLPEAEEGDLLLLQNEINLVDYLIEMGHKRGMKVCLNPAPFGPEVLKYPLDLVDMLIVNEIEGQGLVGGTHQEEVLRNLSKRFPKSEIVMTIGKEGVIYCSGDDQIRIPAAPAEAVDTTAAGDTFIGYFLASRMARKQVKECLQIACKAASICVSRKGAQDSIPDRTEVGV